MWVSRPENCKFIEILPEATLKMGLMLESSILTRASFSILVSESALRYKSRSAGFFDPDKAGLSQFGRKREDINENITNAIEAAATNFGARIQDAKLCLFGDPNMVWFDDLPEAKKILQYTDWIQASGLNEDETTKMVKLSVTLINRLKQFVRGRLIYTFNASLYNDQNHIANENRRAESYLLPYSCDFDMDYYARMTENELMMTRWPWKNIKEMRLSRTSQTNLLPDSDYSSDYGTRSETNQDLAKHHGVQKMRIFDLVYAQGELNQSILKSITEDDFANGQVPEECFIPGMKPLKHGTDRSFVKAALDARQSPKKLRIEPVFNFARHTAIPDDIFHGGGGGSVSSAASVEGVVDLKKFYEGVPETKTDEGAITGGPTSGRLYGTLPIHRKTPADSEILPLLPKRAKPSGLQSETSMAEEGVAFRPTFPFKGAISAVFKNPFGLDTDQDNPRERAIKLHNTAVSTPTADRSTHVPKLSHLNEQNDIFFMDPPELSTTAAAPVPLARPDLKPHVPSDKYIHGAMPFFSLDSFFDQARSHIHEVATKMLQRPEEMDFTTITDTLLCLNDDEYKYLPLWAGGLDDDSGGVFDPTIPPAAPGAGPSGPGPAYHTGYSLDSVASSPANTNDTEDFSVVGASTVGDSIDTVAVENGYSDHFNRRRVLTEDDEIMSEALSEDAHEHYEARLDKGKGKELVGENQDAVCESPAPASNDPGNWDGSDGSDREYDFEYDSGDETEKEYDTEKEE